MKAKYLIGGSIVAVFIVIGLLSFESGSIAYSDIGGAREAAGFVKVKGAWVKESGADYDSERNLFTFHMRDSSDNTIKVVHTGARPNNFELAESIVVEGRIEDNTLQSRHILTKCPSKYEGSTIGDPAEAYGDPSGYDSPSQYGNSASSSESVPTPEDSEGEGTGRKPAS